MSQSLLAQSLNKPNQSLLVVHDDQINEPTCIYLPQTGRLSISYTTKSADLQNVSIVSKDGQSTTINVGTSLQWVELGDALLYSIAFDGLGQADFQLSWEYVTFAEYISCINASSFAVDFSIQWQNADGQWIPTNWSYGCSVGQTCTTPNLLTVGIPSNAPIRLMGNGVNALKFGISDDFIVKDVFAAPK